MNNIIRLWGAASFALLIALLGTAAFPASFKSSYLGEFEVVANDQSEVYHVFQDLDDPTVFRYAPDGLTLGRGPGSPISVVVASGLFDETLSAAFTFVLESNISQEGLTKLKTAIVQRSGVENPKLGSIGSIEYKVYLYIVLDGIADEGYVVRRIDQGTRTAEADIAATLRIESIDESSLKNLLTGDAGALLIAYVQTLPVTYQVGLESSAEQPTEELLQLFAAEQNMPLVNLYQNELANSTQQDVPEIANRLGGLSPSIFGSTPELILETLELGWIVNEERLKRAATTPSETYKFIAKDLTKSTYRVPSLCGYSPGTVIDAEGLGVSCD